MPTFMEITIFIHIQSLFPSNICQAYWWTTHQRRPQRFPSTALRVPPLMRPRRTWFRVLSFRIMLIRRSCSTWFPVFNMCLAMFYVWYVLNCIDICVFWSCDWETETGTAIDVIFSSAVWMWLLQLVNLLLVGGLDHFLFLHVLGMSSSQLTNIFQRDGPGPPTRLHLLADLSLLNMLRLLVLCNADRLRVVVGSWRSWVAMRYHFSGRHWVPNSQCFLSLCHVWVWGS